MKDTQVTDRLAIDQYLDRFHWQEQMKPGVHEALVSLANREKKDYRTVKRDVLVAAVRLVIMQKTEAQPIRIGAKWAGGSRTPVIPLSLDEQDFAAWFAQETRKAAFATALGQSYPDMGGDDDYREYQSLLEHINSGDREWEGKKETLYLRSAVASMAYGDDNDDDRGWYSDDHVAMRRLLEELPARDRSLLNALAEKKTATQIAQETGRSAGAIRTELARLRPKLKERLFELDHSLEEHETYTPDTFLDESREKRLQEWQTKWDADKHEAERRWNEQSATNPEFVLQETLAYCYEKRRPESDRVLKYRSLTNRINRLPLNDLRLPDVKKERQEVLRTISPEAREYWIALERINVRNERWLSEEQSVTLRM